MNMYHVYTHYNYQRTTSSSSILCIVLVVVVAHACDSWLLCEEKQNPFLMQTERLKNQLNERSFSL